MEEKETMEKLVMEESLVAMEEKVKPDLRNLNALFFSFDPQKIHGNDSCSCNLCWLISMQ